MTTKYGGVVAYLATPEFGWDTYELIAQHPSALDDTDLHHDRDRWITIDTILAIVGRRIARPLDASIALEQPRYGTLSPAGPHAPKPCPQENFVDALSLAVNAALLGSPRRLEQFLPSDPTIEQLLQARDAATEMAREPARLYLRHLYSAILTWAAARKTIRWSPDRVHSRHSRNGDSHAYREYIDLHIEEPIRLRDLAKVAGLSRMHFAAQFRAYTGNAPEQFVMMQRIRHAQVLLGDPRKTLADVALSVGFRNQAHFTTVFHRSLATRQIAGARRFLAKTQRRSSKDTGPGSKLHRDGCPIRFSRKEGGNLAFS